MPDLPPDLLALVHAVWSDPADTTAVHALADHLSEHGTTPDGEARVRRLAPQSGDVLVFNIPDYRTFADTAEKVEVLTKALPGVTVISVEADEDVHFVDDAWMAQAGWVRAEEAERLRQEVVFLEERLRAQDRADEAFEERLWGGR